MNRFTFIVSIITFCLCVALTTSCYAQDFRVLEYDHTSIATGDAVYWTGSAWEIVGQLDNPGTSPDLSTSASGGNTWAPTIAEQRAKNLGGWCLVMAHIGTSGGAAPSGNSSYLVFGNLPYDVTNMAASMTCGNVTIGDATAGTERPGFTLAVDNTGDVRIYQEDFASFVSTNTYWVRMICTYRCDLP